MHFFVVVYALSYVRLFLTPWTVAGQAPRSLGFPRQEYWGGVAISSPRDLPNPGTEPASPALAGEFFTTKPPGKPLIHLFFSFRVKKWGNHPYIFLI